MGNSPRFIQEPLKLFLKRFPFYRAYLPMSDQEIDSEPYFVRYTADFSFLEFGFLSDKWQLG